MNISFRSTVPQGWSVNSAVEPFQFPGGEWHLRTPENETPTVATIHGADADNLVILGLWADWARSLGAETIAHIPYLPAARADRGVPFGARVYADLINAAQVDEVVVFAWWTPHESSGMQSSVVTGWHSSTAESSHPTRERSSAQVVSPR